MSTIQPRTAPMSLLPRRAPVVRAGGPVAPQSGNPLTSPPAARPALSVLFSSLAASVQRFFGWLTALFRGPAAPADPPLPAASRVALPPSPSSEPQVLGALPGQAAPATSAPSTRPPAQATTLDASLGLVQLDQQAAIGATVVAARGEARAQGTLALTREATDARVLYQDPTTAAEGHYTRRGDQHAVGGELAKRFEHSALAVGGEYAWSPEGDGGKVYGRWQTDQVGETVGGFRVRGGVEAGAIKVPGETWSTYAAGRLSADRGDTSLYLEGRHQGGTAFGAPETQVSVGLRMTF